MTPLIPALSGALVVAGLIGVIVGMRPAPPRPSAAPTRSRLVSRLTHMSRLTRILLAVGAVLGLLVTLLTGWVIALILVPAAVAGLPILLVAPLNDATGDLVAVNLILGARRRGQGLASVLESLAESVAADVRARRAVEADRAKPRNTARWVTIITVTVLGFLALTGDYIAPYGTPLGQILLAALLAVYVALLAWMRNMAKGVPAPRFMGPAAREGARA
jgi:uncharacterized membrane protein